MDDTKIAPADATHSSSVNSFFRRKNMEVAYLGLGALWDSERANRIISAITGPYALFSSSAASEKLLEILLQVEQVILSTGADITVQLWTQGSGALLVYLRFKERYSSIRKILSEVSEALQLGQEDSSDSDFFISARDELCGLYRDAYELLEVLKFRHASIWAAQKNEDATIFLPNAVPNFSTVSHIFLCTELYQCVCMLHLVITSAQFRGFVDATTFPDPLLLVCNPGSSNNCMHEFPILTRSYVTSATSRLNAVLADRKGALPVEDVVALAF